MHTFPCIHVSQFYIYRPTPKQWFFFSVLLKLVLTTVTDTSLATHARHMYSLMTGTSALHAWTKGTPVEDAMLVSDHDDF